MSTALAPLISAIDDLLALDPDTLTDTELHEPVIDLQRQRARLAAVSARRVARWDARQVWADDGSRSSASRLAREAKLSNATAHREVRRARQLRTMDATAAALADASISTDHVDLLGRANQRWRDAWFAEHEASLVGHCENLRFADARRSESSRPR